jgi:hypothetical protein
MTYRVMFDPLYVGRGHRDTFIVVNLSRGFSHPVPITEYLLKDVKVMAFDPFTGEELDMKMVEEIPPGRGDEIVITVTIPRAHASLPVVLLTVSPVNNQLPQNKELDINNVNDLPFLVTRLLVDRKHRTILKERGIPILITRNAQP